jgi:hypothetical protein
LGRKTFLEKLLVRLPINARVYDICSSRKKRLRGI